MATVRQIQAENEVDAAKSLLISAATRGHSDPETRENLRDLPLDKLTRIALDRVVRDRW